MPRRPRSELPDGTFHVTTRSAARCDIFRDDVDRHLFLTLVVSAVRDYDWHVHAFCLVTTEYHLVLDAARADLSNGLQRVNGVYAQSFNARHDRRGHLFGDRFGAWAIEDEDELLSTCEAVLLEPVLAGLCRRAEDWPWSASRFGTDTLEAASELGAARLAANARRRSRAAAAVDELRELRRAHGTWSPAVPRPASAAGESTSRPAAAAAAARRTS